MKSGKLVRKLLLAAAISTALSAAPLIAAVNDQDIANDATTPNDVVSYGLGLQGQRFSPLDKLNTETVKNLTPAFVLSYGDEKQRGQEAQPLVSNGKIFVTASY